MPPAVPAPSAPPKFQGGLPCGIGGERRSRGDLARDGTARGCEAGRLHAHKNVQPVQLGEPLSPNGGAGSPPPTAQIHFQIRFRWCCRIRRGRRYFWGRSGEAARRWWCTSVDARRDGGRLAGFDGQADARRRLRWANNHG